MLRLNINSAGDEGEIRSRLKDVYERIAGSDDYARNQNSLRLIQVCVITISACATGFVNAFAHRERLGWVGASLLAILITGFVEKFYFALRHGMTTIYKSRKQRFFASLCCRVIQITMILNAGILCAWVVGAALPESLRLYNRWSLAIHFSLALIGVSAVRDADAVVEDRIRKLKAEAVQEDILTTRRAAINDNPLVLAAARLRGFLDGMSLAINLLRDKPDPSTCNVNQITGGPQRLFLHSGGDGEQAATDVDAYVYIDRGGKERNPGEQPSDKQGSRGENAGERPAQSTANDGRHKDGTGMISIGKERRGSGDEDERERPVEAESNEPANDQASQWLKSILPEMTNGWWDVYPKGRGFAVKFCWRDPERQTLTFPRISYERFQTLRQSDPDEVEKNTFAEISAHLHSLSMNPDRRDKALTVARKLGIDLDEYQITGSED